MVVFGIITKNDSCVEAFFKKKIKELQENSFTKIIMNYDIKTLTIENDNLLTILKINFFL